MHAADTQALSQGWLESFLWEAGHSDWLCGGVVLPQQAVQGWKRILGAGKGLWKPRVFYGCNGAGLFCDFRGKIPFAIFINCMQSILSLDIVFLPQIFLLDPTFQKHRDL